MNLLRLFNSLDIPVQQNNPTSYLANRIPNFDSFRIAINSEGFPVLLFSVVGSHYTGGLQNFKLKYLQLIHSLECKVSENGLDKYESLTVITFKSRDKVLQEYFLKISEPFIKTLENKPNQSQIGETILRFVEVFRSLGEVSNKTVQGLWAELFLIYNSKYPKKLINYWHVAPEEKFDFNSGKDKVEVKSSSTLLRIHAFSLGQLNPPPDNRVLIASIFTRSTVNGKSLIDLVDMINEKIGGDVNLISKVYALVAKILGNTLEDSLEIRYDIQIAADSLRFYKYQDIKKIDPKNIPIEVTDLKYRSDLSDIHFVNPSIVNKDSVLFSAL